MDFSAGGRVVTPPQTEKLKIPERAAVFEASPKPAAFKKAGVSSEEYRKGFSFLKKFENSKLLWCEQSKVEKQAGERIGVKPPSGGTKSGSARLDLRGFPAKIPICQNFYHKFG